MKFSGSLLSLLFGAATSAAMKVSFQKATKSNGPLSNLKVLAAASDDNSLSLSTVHDYIYMANITLGNTAYVVQLDTGSSDLWIKGDSSPLPNTNQTSTNYNLTYGIGWAYGSLSYADVEFADIHVSQQAFLDVSNANNPALGYGANGILGLGFTSLSTIDARLNETGSSAGRSFLYNMFEDNPSEPNFISFSFQRSTQANDDVEGTFSIGEYEDQYKAVQDQTAIPTWPENSPNRWNVLLDALLVGDQTYTPTTTVPGAPSNKAVVLLDSGTSFTYAPEDMVNAIYSNVEGASYSSSLGQWQVPCDAEIDMALQFNGQVYPVHPLDVTATGLTTDSSTCLGTFVPQSVSVGAGQFDWLIGDNVLRAVYSIYDFGDFDSNNQMGNPYVKLLSLVDPNEASSEFVTARGGTARTNITYNAANSGSSSTSVSVSNDVANTLNSLSVYLPAMLAVMALNALVLLGLLIFGIVYLCKRRKSKRMRTPARTPNGRLSPMPMNTRNSYIAGNDLAQEEHVYQPVSMAITDDTLFGPPSPGFKRFDGAAGDRPKSLATLPSQSKLYQQIGSEEQLYNPSPAFMGDNRPKSVGGMPNQPEDQPFVVPPYHKGEETLVKSDTDSIISDRRSVRNMSMDQPRENMFVPPALPSPENRLSAVPSSASVASFHSARESAVTPMTVDITDRQMMSQSHDHLPHTPQSAPTPTGGNTLRPILRHQLSDRPRSAMLPSAGPADPLSPPSAPGMRPGFNGRFADRPMSAMLPNQQSPEGPNAGSPLRPLLLAERRPSRDGGPMTPPSPTVTVTPPAQQSQHRTQGSRGGDVGYFSPPAPAYRGSQLRENPSTADRPMSVGVLPSQQQIPQTPPQGARRGSPPQGVELSDPGFSPPNPAFARQGSSLRPGAGSAGDRPMSMA